jgi:hypothetical protein
METAAPVYSTNYRTVAANTLKSRKSVLIRSKSLTLHIDKIQKTPPHASITLHINKMDNVSSLKGKSFD